MWSDNLKSKIKIDGARAEKMQSNNHRLIVVEQKLLGGNYVLI
jgi:hypothetical protein